MNIDNIILSLNQRPIAYYPIYTKIAGGTAAGILLSQLMYWLSAVNGREFYKTDDEIMQETGLSAKELRLAKAKLKASIFVKIKVKGVPPKTFYKFDLKQLAEKLDECQQERLNSGSPKGENNLAEKAISISPKG